MWNVTTPGLVSAAKTGVVTLYSAHSSVMVKTWSPYPDHGSAPSSGLIRKSSVPSLHLRKAETVYFLPSSKTNPPWLRP